MHEQKINIAEAAEYTGFSRTQITRAAKTIPPRLKAYWLGDFGPLAFTKPDLDEWVASMANTNRSPVSAKAQANAAKARKHKARTTTKAGA